MTAKEILGLLVRAWGLYTLFSAAYSMLFAAIDAGGLALHAQYVPLAHVLFSFFYFIVGAVLINYADRIVDFAYRDQNKSQPDSGAQ